MTSYQRQSERISELYNQTLHLKTELSKSDLERIYQQQRAERAERDLSAKQAELDRAQQSRRALLTCIDGLTLDLLREITTAKVLPPMSPSSMPEGQRNPPSLPS